MTPDNAETTIEEDLAAALAAHGAEEAAPVEETQTNDDGGAERGPDGKFKAKEEAPEPEVPTEPTTEEAPVIPDRYGVPPNYAKKAIREKWGELPTEVRQELHEREREFHQQLTKYDEDRNFGKKVKEVVAPFEGFIRSLGAEPLQAVDYLVKTDYALRTAPPEQRKALFIKAAADYGIQLDGVQMEVAPSDPRLETLQQRLDRLEREQNAAIQAKQFEEQRSLEQQIEDFRSKPENVYFDRVSPMMASLLSSGAAQTLEQAYDMAVHADPETRVLQLAAKTATEESQRSQQQKAAAQRAKAASVSVTGAPGTVVPASSPSSAGSLEDDIRQAIHAASSRI